MHRRSAIGARAALSSLFAISGCAQIVGLTGDYHEAAGAGGRGHGGGVGDGGLSGAGAMAGGVGGAGAAGESGASGAGEGGISAGGVGGAGGIGGARPGGNGGGGMAGEAGSPGGAGASGGEAGSTAGSGGVPPGPACGDGVRDLGEGCDDHNTTSGDGCSAECQVEAGWVCKGSLPTTCTRASCVGMHGDECGGHDCCESLPVPGGTFTQGPNPDDPDTTSFSSTLADFELDRFEVTVARFANFVNAYNGWLAGGGPLDGDGSHQAVPSTGWDPAWPLPASDTQLKNNLRCDPDQTWSATPAGDTRPVNCVSWFVAFAFCIWDGARLPAESEFEYAAGGATPSVYPWGDSPATASRAVYDCLGDNSAAGDCSVNDILDVGSKDSGHGPFGHEDLAGSMWEWQFDWYGAYPKGPRTNYVGPLSASPDYRAVRGGSWQFSALFLERASRSNNDPTALKPDIGFRCARDR